VSGSTEPRFVPARDADAVVVGASAGGVPALLALLRALPAGFAPALLAVLHLPPQRPSNLAGVLGFDCRLPVQEALDKQPIERGVVLVAPPDYHLLVEPGRCVALSVDPPVLHARPAIDPLVEAAAAVSGARLRALLLTGASSDGSVGLAAVRAAGGQAWVQDPAEAVAGTMPAAAIAFAGADEVMDLATMAQRLGEVVS
jgi:two-component system chemotaxis response regulator CheB